LSIVSVEKDFDGLSLILIAEFDAPIERVWQLWADPRQLERWWGPPTHPATVEKHYLVAGGEVSYFMTGPAGERSRGWWRVTSVSPPTSLEFTDGYAKPDGTRMELRFSFESREHMAQLERSSAFEIFPQSVAQMDDVLATSLS
jgi:uncharacterized protein YndB with AHSA1/START domain